MTMAEQATEAGALPKISIRRAEPGDLAEVLAVLNASAASLHRRGVEQWLDGFGPDRLGPPVQAGYTWLAEGAGTRLAVATITLTPELDPDFWTEAERAGPALQVSKLATAPWAAGAGIGAAVLRWAMDRAARMEVPVVRLDVWRTNSALQRWYQEQGFDYVRTETVMGRNSGALFAKAAGLDPEAQQLEAPEWLARRGRTSLRKGDRVRFDDGRTGTIRYAIQPDGSAQEDGTVRMARTYGVDLDGGGGFVQCADIQIAPIWTDLN